MTVEVSPESVDALPGTGDTSESIAGGRWAAVVSWFDARLNPIFVKEVRQSFKSGGFQWTFLLLIVGTWLYTIAAAAGEQLRATSLQGYVEYSGTNWFAGYFVLLSLALLVGLPIQAGRSMAADVSAETFELLSITALHPWRIVFGKLAVVVLKISVLFSVVLPCLVVTYMLGGVPLPGVLLALILETVCSLLLCTGAMLVGSIRQPLVRGTASTILLLLLIWWGGIGFVGFMFEGGGSLFGGLSLEVVLHWLAVLATLGTAIFLLMIATIKASLTFPTDNRSTAIRAALLLVTCCVVGWQTFWVNVVDSGVEFVIVVPWVLTVVVLWGAGSLIIGESPVMSRRVRRELPRSQLGNLLLGVFYPGPGRGYAFIFSLLAAMILIWTTTAPLAEFSGNALVVYRGALLLTELAVLYLGIGLLLLRLFVRAEKRSIWWGLGSQLLLLGVVVTAQITMAMVGSVWSSSRLDAEVFYLSPFGVWDSLVDWIAVPILGAAAGVVFVLNLLVGTGAEMLVTRAEKPQRVIEEEKVLHPKEEEPLSPWD
ncbi:MAG: hypothetical protein D6741_07525 [Planctomycetota bacterium]|nr:MAG: hypothetical protein D6741_07525 [Planctomycetota bacterium]